jgi:formate dehydrogenase iron-sulfur subunit
VTLLSSVAPVEETPVDRYLASQAELTVVGRFAQRHQAEEVALQARYYRDLIPLTAPGPGQQYGFEVDLDACTGCKACVAACHSLNGLDDGESWRSVSLLVGGTVAKPFQQTVTSACHHCVDPACLNGCPVDAYEKDPVTGIVAHLDDQCIGCGYCTLTCPYEVPRYNRERGIVRKCDMCHGRLAAGEAPACVQACPSGAISIAIVEVADAMASAAAGSLVPGAPPSSITAPTTVYRTGRDRLPAATRLRPASMTGPDNHRPLAVMLVLTQLSVGAFVTDLVARVLSPGADAVLVAVVGALALAASVLHLGRPRYCYRAVIGLRHSWLSREVLAFGAFTGLAMVDAVWPHLPGLGGAVALAGLAGVACSVMVYAATRRPSWRAGRVAADFALTAAGCGAATVAWAALVSGSTGVNGARPLLAVVAVVLVAKVGMRQRVGVVTPVLLVATALAGISATLLLGSLVLDELRQRARFFR